MWDRKFLPTHEMEHPEKLLTYLPYDGLNAPVQEDYFANCPLLPGQTNMCHFEASSNAAECSQCDPTLPPFPVAHISHPVFVPNQIPYFCEHKVELHRHSDRPDLRISGGHLKQQENGEFSVAKRSSTPVKRIAREIAEECEHFLRRADCQKCSIVDPDEGNTSINSDASSGTCTTITNVKKQKNKEAAQKYRNRLKSRFAILQEEEKLLSAKNSALQEESRRLEAHVQWYRTQLRENAARWRKLINLND